MFEIFNFPKKEKNHRNFNFFKKCVYYFVNKQINIVIFPKLKFCIFTKSLSFKKVFNFVQNCLFL